MPLTPDKLETRTVAVTFSFGDEDFTVKYRPRALSNDKIIRANKALERGQELNAIYEDPESDDETKAKAKAEADRLDTESAVWFAEMIAWWEYFEYVNEDGTPGPMVPLTPERLVEEMDTHTDLFNACLSAISQDYNKSKTNGIDSSLPSGATSSATGRSTSSTVGRSLKVSR